MLTSELRPLLGPLVLPDCAPPQRQLVLAALPELDKQNRPEPHGKRVRRCERAV
jgi:hypothetical protein